MECLFNEKNTFREMGVHSELSSILFYNCLIALFQTPNGKTRLDIVFNPITQRDQRTRSTAT